jgi:hypothetical protein
MLDVEFPLLDNEYACEQREEKIHCPNIAVRTLLFSVRKLGHSCPQSTYIWERNKTS